MRKAAPRAAFLHEAHPHPSGFGRMGGAARKFGSG
jgi:hypothetical protein